MLTGRFEEARQAVKKAEKAGLKVPRGLKTAIDEREAAAKKAGTAEP